MDKSNLETMSLEDLRALRSRVERAISSFEDRRRRDALAAAEQVAREHGFALADLTGKGGRGRRGGAVAGRSSAEAKYANPADPSQTWSGRGRRPRWVAEHVDAGRALDDLAV